MTRRFAARLLKHQGVLVDPLMQLGIRIVEAMFVIGALGSAIVLVWVGFEDFHTVFKPGEEEE